METLKVTVQKDHLNKVTSSSPIQAIAELIWNAVDADATKVDVFFNNTALLSNNIIVRDNGHGIPHSEAKKAFSKLGGSWKKEKGQSPKGRYLHGQEGQGRFKSFSIGRVVEWKSSYKTNDHKIASFTVTCKAESIDKFDISDVTESGISNTGCTVTISEPNKKFHSLNKDNAIENLAPVFTTYLASYKDVAISIEGSILDPSEFVKKKEVFTLDAVNYKGTDYPYELEIIEWKTGGSDNELYFCNTKGFPIQKYSEKLKKSSNTPYTAYLKSEHISALNNDGTLSLGDLAPSLKEIIDKAKDEITNYIIKNKISASSEKLQKWKDERVYPYASLPKNPVESAERQIFDILALNIAENIPSFDESEINLKKFQFRLLKQIVENSPEELQVILSEVMKLSKEKQGEFAELLKDVSLSSIISTSNLISDRLKFLRGLEEVIFTKGIKKHFKERSQLHKIVSENTWIFGDTYSLTANDESLRRVLEAHQKKCKIEAVIDKPVLRVDGRVGIVDLMLSRSIPCNHSDQREHLIVELKAPKVKINRDGINQIKDYAMAVSDDERFRSLDTRWEFIIVSNELDRTAHMELKQEAYQNGVIFKTGKNSNPSITVRIKTWSEIIAESKHRLKFLQNQLNINVESTEGIRYLKEKYSEYTEGVVMDEPEDAVA